MEHDNSRKSKTTEVRCANDCKSAETSGASVEVITIIMIFAFVFEGHRRATTRSTFPITIKRLIKNQTSRRCTRYSALLVAKVCSLIIDAWKMRCRIFRVRPLRMFNYEVFEREGNGGGCCIVSRRVDYVLGQLISNIARGQWTQFAFR